MKSRNHRPAAKRSTGGFTIIETLIVLAIAGFILLIVFETIPALERSSRNNQRKQDVQTVLAAVSHYELSNSGDLPGSPSPNFLQYVQLTYYDQNTVEYMPHDAPTTAGINVYIKDGWTLAPAGVTGNKNINMVKVYNYQKCNSSNNGGSSRSGAGYSDVVALYALEQTTPPGTPQCQQL